MQTAEMPRLATLFQQLRHFGNTRFRAGVIGFQIGPRAADAADSFVAHLNRHATGQCEDVGDVALRGRRLVGSRAFLKIHRRHPKHTRGIGFAPGH